MSSKVIKRGFRKPSKSYKKDTKEEEDLIGSLTSKVEEELQSQGVQAFDNSNVMEDYLELPNDLTEVESKELGKYFTTFTNQKLYVRGLIWQSGALIRELNAKLDFIRADVYAMLPAKTSIKEKELALLTNKNARELLDKVNFIQEKHRMLETYLDNLIDAIVCISREITRRESDWQMSNREDNINNKRRR